MPDSGDVAALLRVPPQKELLRFLTCGSVDDGKSTLIGRLLHDAGQLADDQLEALARDSRRHGTTGGDLDFALLLDGLEAEREQGITIDVAYRFFSTDRRAFIVADTPGHEQYTRNMATGASASDLAVILVDVRKGLTEQTRRHSAIADLLGIRKVVLAVNKMDLVNWDPARFAAVEEEYRRFSGALGFTGVTAIPLSARFGDNVRTRSDAAPWWRGPTLLEHLETVDVTASPNAEPFRFAVQWVNRPNADFRGYSGTVASGAASVGEPVVVAGSGRTSRITAIVTADGELQQAHAGEAVTLRLADEIDLARGDLLSGTKDRPAVADRLSAQVLWLADAPLRLGQPYLLKIGTRLVSARITAVSGAANDGAAPQTPPGLAVNEIGLCEVTTAEPIPFDAYRQNRRTGAFVLIDPDTNATAAAGLIEGALRRAADVHLQDLSVRREDREKLHGHRGACLWFTGLSGAGKSTIASLVERELHDRGLRTYLLDGDNLRHGLCGDLGFSDAERAENVRRVAEVAKLFVDSGAVVLCSLISPFRAQRAAARGLFEDGDFLEVFVDTPREVCAERDPKGLYAKALAGGIKNFTGVTSPYEPPTDAEVVVNGARSTAQDSAEAVLAAVLSRLG